MERHDDPEVPIWVEHELALAAADIALRQGGWRGLTESDVRRMAYVVRWAVRKREDASHLRELAQLLAPQGRWDLQTSNSWRRIGTERGDGDILCPITQRDGHPDLQAAPNVLRYLVEAQPNRIIRLLAQVGQ